jgi:hypothetical protein
MAIPVNRVVTISYVYRSRKRYASIIFAFDFVYLYRPDNGLCRSNDSVNSDHEHLNVGLKVSARKDYLS